jgi:hypothetical protein
MKNTTKFLAHVLQLTVFGLLSHFIIELSAQEPTPAEAAKLTAEFEHRMAQRAKSRFANSSVPVSEASIYLAEKRLDLEPVDLEEAQEIVAAFDALLKFAPPAPPVQTGPTVPPADPLAETRATVAKWKGIVWRLSQNPPAP